jgi:uncharacterized membrane protein YkoI
MWCIIGKGTAMKKRIQTGLLAILLLGPAMAAGQVQQQPPTGTERKAPVAKITEEQATKIALERIPGKVTEVTIERKRGRDVYVVEIQTPKGEKDVFVDIVSGEIVGID